MRKVSTFEARWLYRLERGIALLQGKGFWRYHMDREAAAVATLAHPPVLTVVDVGANGGEWTASVRRHFPDAHFHLFEPSGECMRGLKTRFGQDPRVTLNQVALGRAAGAATLYADEAGSVMASLTQRKLGHRGIRMDFTEQVRVQTLDSYARSAGLDTIDILKIDVEGHELDVLAGAAEILERTRVVQFEFGGTNIDTRTFLRDFWQLLIDAGFTIYRIAPLGLVPVREYKETIEDFAFANYVAARPQEIR
jgi:FkbM family methyltransferase